MADITRNFGEMILDAAAVPQLDNASSHLPLKFNNDVTLMFHGRDPRCCLLSGDRNPIRKNHNNGIYEDKKINQQNSQINSGLIYY